MLTRTESKVLEWIYWLCSKSLAIPFKWTSGKLFKKSTFKQYSIYNSVLWILMLMKIVLKINQVKVFFESGNINKSILHGFLALAPIGHLVCKLSVWSQVEELKRLVNEVGQANCLWAKTFLGQEFMINPNREKAFVLLSFGVLEAALLWSVVEILIRNDVGSLFQFVPWSSNILVAVVAVIEIILMLEYAIIVLFIIASVFYSYFPMRFWLKKFCMQRPNTEMRDNENVLLSAETYISHYRAIYILNNDCNTAFGTIFLPFMKLLFMAGFVLCFVACVRHFSVLDPLIVVLMAAILCITQVLLVPISIVMSSLYDMSSGFSRSILEFCPARNSVGQRVLEKEAKSCPVIRCQVGGLYYMEAKAKLTMLSRIIDALVFLLLKS